MAIQGEQELSNITFNYGQITGTNRDMEINVLDNLSNPEEWQQGGGNPYQINITNSSATTYIQSFTGGAHLLSTLRPGSSLQATGIFNKNVLQSGLSGFPGNILQIPGGVYYINGPLDSGILNGLRSCFLDGLSADSSWQLHEAFPSNDKRGVTLVFQGMSSGDIAINFPCTRATGNNDLHGPYVFRNIRIECATGSAIQIGHPNSIGGAIGSAVTRGVVFDSASISLSPQNWTNNTTGFIQEYTTIRENARIDRTRPRTFGLRLYGPYDCTIRNTPFIGGYIGLDVYEADNPFVFNCHFGHQYISARHTIRPGRVSVEGVWHRIFVENAAMCGVLLGGGDLVKSRLEFGYTTPVGAYNMYPGVTWSINEGSNVITLVGLTGGRTTYDYFEERIPFSVVDSATNRKYWLQPTGFTSGTMLFSHSGDISYINRNMSGSVITRYYGTTFVQEGDGYLDGISASYNNTVSGTPIGFIIPGSNRSTVTNFGPHGIGNFTTGNQVVVLGHNRATQFRNNPGVDWFGGNNILMPQESPLADIWGVGPYDANACSYIMTPTETSIPDRKWVATKGQGISPASNVSFKVELLKDRGRFVEDWSRSSEGRYVKLIGLHPESSINFGYTLRARNNGASSATVNVSCRNLNVTSQSVGSHSVGTGWGLYTGGFTATGLGAANPYAVLQFSSTGSILCESIIVKRLDANEVFGV